jgi:hypothetical protein
MSKRPDYHVFVSEKTEGSTFYTRVGAAWLVAKEGISIKLRALPVTGELVLFPPKEGD